MVEANDLLTRAGLPRLRVETVGNHHREIMDIVSAEGPSAGLRFMKSHLERLERDDGNAFYAKYIRDASQTYPGLNPIFAI